MVWPVNPYMVDVDEIGLFCVAAEGKFCEYQLVEPVHEHL
jgi:hypothetical protein